VWRVPFSAYPEPNTRDYVVLGSWGYYKTVGDPDQHNKGFGMVVPKPFGTTYRLADPVVTGVSQSTVRPGGQFSIAGSGFYPSLVQSVLIGGKALDPTNFKAVSDQVIQVVVPNTPGTAQPVIVSTAQGFSNNDVTINIQS
jgi:hypothetical protein